MRSQSPLPADSKDVAFPKYRVVFRYSPQHDDELSINEGDIITVLHEVEEGWWKGVLNGQVGMFPSNFVEEIEEPAGGPKINELNGNASNNKDQSRSNSVSPHAQLLPKIVGSANSAFHPIQSKREDRDLKNEPFEETITSIVQLDIIQTTKHAKSITNSADAERQSYEKDKITISIGDELNRRDKEAATRVPSSSLDSGPPQLPPRPVRELARVLFPYSADHDDELELNEGDIITVICKELEDRGWWKGELNNKVGVFPDNFVDLLTVDEVVKPPRPEKRPTALPKPKHPPDTQSAPKKDMTPSPIPSVLKKSPSVPQARKSGASNSTVNDLSGDSTDGNDSSLFLDREHHLIHRTQTRPKGPSNRRPPSQTFLDEKKTSFSEDEDMHSVSNESLQEEKGKTSTNSQTSEVPWMKELKANQKKKKLLGSNSIDTATKPTTVDGPSCLQANPRRRTDITPPTKARTSTGSLRMESPASAPNTSAASTNGFKDDSVAGQCDYDTMLNKLRAEFNPQIKKLEERLIEQQQRHSRQIIMLMDELGEERQKIACLQIDINRLTKLNSSDANV